MLSTQIINVVVKLIEIVIEKFLSLLTFDILNEVLLKRSLEVKTFCEKILSFCQGNTVSYEIIRLFVQKIVKLLEKLF